MALTVKNLSRICAGLLFLLATARGYADIVYQNFFDNAYSGASREIRWFYEPPNPSVSSSLGVAGFFSVAAGVSYRLDSVTLPMDRYSGATNLEVALFANNGNAPGVELEVLAVNPTQIAGTPGLYTFNSSLSPLLEGGSVYWVVLQPHDHNVSDTTQNSSYDWYSTFFGIGSVGTRDYDFAAGDWDSWTIRGGQQLPAFRVDGTAVPEPGTWALFSLGSLLLWCATWRRMK